MTDQISRGATTGSAGRLMPAPKFWPRFCDTLHPPVRGFANLVLNTRVVGVENIPDSGPLILAGNHSGWLDGPLVVFESPRMVRCLVKSEIFKGAFAKLLTGVGQIPVDRGRADRAALHSCLSVLAEGGVVGLFPEGTRGSGELEAVQPGIAYIAVHSGAPIVPVACLGTNDALPKGRVVPRRSAPITIAFGEQFSVKQPENPRSRRALAAVAEDIRVRMADHVASARQL